MKSENRILTAFILNLFFSLVEIVGGIFTGSAAILADAVHDIGDAASIGLSYAFEKKSKRKPDGRYTYGYGRYSAAAGAITLIILIVGSIMAIVNAAVRMIHPAEVDYNGMIALSIFGTAVNLIAALVTRQGSSLSQKAVNLHMLEDVCGWIAVLVGAVVMRFTDLAIIDPIMSVGIALFILYHAAGGIAELKDVFFECAPKQLDCREIEKKLASAEGVAEVHHLHIWSIDGKSALATVHAVVAGDDASAKRSIKRILADCGIIHATVETEPVGEECEERECFLHSVECEMSCHHHHCH